jgi:hypothetical protein
MMATGNTVRLSKLSVAACNMRAKMMSIKRRSVASRNGSTNADEAVSSYQVVVTTSSESSSGTDSSVFLKLVGDGGNSGEFELKQSENFNKFETGQVDTFTFQSNVALGNVLQAHVRLQADGNLIKKSWRLRSIEVSGGDLSAPVKFEHGQVLSPDNPAAVLHDGVILSESQMSSAQQFLKGSGESWQPSELADVEEGFRACDKNYVQDRR